MRPGLLKAERRFKTTSLLELNDDASASVAPVRLAAAARTDWNVATRPRTAPGLAMKAAAGRPRRAVPRKLPSTRGYRSIGRVPRQKA